MKGSRILIVDDERTIRLTFRLALETEGCVVNEAASAAEAHTRLDAEPFDLIVLDLRIGDDSGLDVLAEMRARGVKTPTLMITAYGSIRQAVRAMQLGAIDFLEKPIEPVALREVVGEILERHRLKGNQGGGFEGCVREAKRLVNLQALDRAAEQVAEALRLNDESAEAHNLQGVLREIAGDYDNARKSYGRAIRLDRSHEAAQQNMRRLFELFNFGSSVEPLHMGEKS